MNLVSTQENKINKYGIVLVVIIAVIARLIFVHPGLGEPDSYREAFSALQYLEQGTFSFYWDHPLNMWILVAVSYLAHFLNIAPHIIANILAVILGSLTLFPWMWSINIIAGIRISFAWGVCLALHPVFIYYSTYWNHENTGMFFTALAFASWIWSIKNNRKGRFFVFGIFYGLALTSRYYYALGLVPVLALAFYLLQDKEEINLEGLSITIPGILLTFAALVPRDTLGAWVGSSYYLFISWWGYVNQTLQLAWNDLGGAVIVGPIFYILIWLKGFKKEALFVAGWIVPYFLFCLNYPTFSRYLLVSYMGIWYLVIRGCNILIAPGISSSSESVEYPEEFNMELSDNNNSKTTISKRKDQIKRNIIIVLLLALLLGSSWFSTSSVRPLKKNMLKKTNKDQIIANEIVKRVGDNLLLIYSWQTMLLYYNFDKPQKCIYVIKRMGNKRSRLAGVNEAIEEINKGLPVYATRLALRLYRNAHLQVEADLVWEYDDFQLFKITQINLDNSPI